MLRSIRLSSILLDTYIGCLPSERTRTNRLECEVLLTLDQPFSTTDDEDRLEGTVDYRVIEEVLREVAASRHFNMMESLGETFLVALAAREPMIRRASITLRKPGAMPSGAVPEVTMVWPDDGE